MASFLFRLGRGSYRHRWVVLVGWVLALVALGTSATTFQKPMQDTFTIPGIPSEQAADLQKELFPGAQDAMTAPTVTVVVAADKGHTLSEPAYKKKVAALIGDLRGLPQMGDPRQQRGLVNPVQAAVMQKKMIVQQSTASGTPRPVAVKNAEALSPLSTDGRIGTLTFTFAEESVGDVEESTFDALEGAIADSQDRGLTTEMMGTGSMSQAPPQGASELIGMAVAAIVLIFTFGSLVAAGLPLVNAIFAVAAGSMGIMLATLFTDISSMTSVLAVMLGLAVGIDYALFIMSRFKHDISVYPDRATAAGHAVATAGSAVVFAGTTVIIALAALSVVGIPFLTVMGLAAAFTVALAVIMSLSLLPAVLGVLGGKVFAGKVPVVKAPDPEVERRTMGNRWTHFVERHKFATALVPIVVLGIVAIPAAGLTMALPTDSTADTSTTQRRAADLAREGFGPGRENPFLLVVDAREATSDPQVARQAAGLQKLNPRLDQATAVRQVRIGQVNAWASKQSGVVNAQVVAMNKQGTGAQIMITPSSAPTDQATTDLLDSLRHGEAGIEKTSSTQIGVTGLAAIQDDVSQQLSDALAPYLIIVVGLAFLVLMLVFRSVLVPLTAALGFLLSVLATIGATVWGFQEGHLGITSAAPTLSFLPIILIGIVFGLAMDYQVFLVSRMREAYTHGDSAVDAVNHGFRHGARVVTAAALIMMSVFAAFILQDMSFAKTMGFALAVAILFDAFFVRMTLIPAIMHILGDKAWWYPRWMAKITPRIDIEGENLQLQEDAPARHRRPRHAPVI